MRRLFTKHGRWLLLLCVATPLVIASYCLGRVHGELRVYDYQYARSKQVLDSSLGAEIEELNLSIDRSSDGRLFLFGPPIPQKARLSLRSNLTQHFGKSESEFMLANVGAEESNGLGVQSKEEYSKSNRSGLFDD